MSDHKRLNLILRFCCAITGTDPDILKECNKVDRHRIVRHCLGLMCTFIMATVVWSFVLSEMLPVWGAIMGGLFAGLIIYLLDLSISTSDWEMKGILRQPSSFGRFLVRSWKWLFRLGLAMTLALVTGTYVTLFVFRETLDEKIHQERIAFNQPVEEEFQNQREQMRTDLIAPIQRDLDAAMAERSNLQNLLLNSQAMLSAAGNTVSEARSEMHREETGLGRAAGKGKRYQDAKIRFEEAERHMVRAEQDIEHARLRLGEVEIRIDGINNRLHDAEKAFDTRVTILAQERDAKLMPARSDFLMRFTALNELRADEQHGYSIFVIVILTKLTLVIFEIIFLLKLANDHASVYTMRLIGRTRLEAARVDNEFARAMNMVGQEQAESNSFQHHDHDQRSGFSPGPDDASSANKPSEPDRSNETPFTEPENEGPLFEQTTQTFGDDRQNDEPVDPTTHSCDSGHSSCSDAAKYPVIGGEPGEMVTIV